MKEVKDLVEKNNVVTLEADYTGTDKEAELDAMRKRFQFNVLPLYLIFPAGRPDEPIRLDGLITKGQILRALEKAGPSRAAETVAVGENAVGTKPVVREAALSPR